MKVSIILPCFKRIDYLNYTLWSLTQQKVHYDLETIVLNDYLFNSGAGEVCKKYQKDLNIKYFFTGQRHGENKIIKRDQGFVLNIGVKQAKGDIIILAHNGLFHLNNTIDLIVEPLKNDRKLLSTQKYIFFDNEKIVNYLSKKLVIELPNNLFLIPKSRFWGTQEESGLLPYWMAMYKEEFTDIGGHDEDFTGICGLDDDLMHRLKLNGLQYNYCDAKIVHLYHPKYMALEENRWENTKWVYNTFLRFARKGIIIRNTDKEWGKL